MVKWLVKKKRMIGFEYKDGMKKEERKMVEVKNFIKQRD